MFCVGVRGNFCVLHHFCVLVAHVHHSELVAVFTYLCVSGRHLLLCVGGRCLYLFVLLADIYICFWHVHWWQVFICVLVAGIYLPVSMAGVHLCVGSRCLPLCVDGQCLYLFVLLADVYICWWHVDWWWVFTSVLVSHACLPLSVLLAGSVYRYICYLPLALLTAGDDNPNLFVEGDVYLIYYPEAILRG